MCAFCRTARGIPPPSFLPSSSMFCDPCAEKPHRLQSSPTHRLLSEPSPEQCEDSTRPGLQVFPVPPSEAASRQVHFRCRGHCRVTQLSETCGSYRCLQALCPCGTPSSCAALLPNFVCQQTAGQWILRLRIP